MLKYLSHFAFILQDEKIPFSFLSTHDSRVMTASPAVLLAHFKFKLRYISHFLDF